MAQFSRLFPRGLAVAVGLLLVVASRAASDGNSIKKDITLDSPTEVATTKLPAGTYRLTVNGTQATFERDGKVIAKVPFMWKQLTEKARYDALVFSKGTLTEVDFAGKTQVIDFAAAGGSAEAGSSAPVNQ